MHFRILNTLFRRTPFSTNSSLFRRHYMNQKEKRFIITPQNLVSDSGRSCHLIDVIPPSKLREHDPTEEICEHLRPNHLYFVIDKTLFPRKNSEYQHPVPGHLSCFITNASKMGEAGSLIHDSYASFIASSITHSSSQNKPLFTKATNIFSPPLWEGAGSYSQFIKVGKWSKFQKDVENWKGYACEDPKDAMLVTKHFIGLNLH